VENPHEFTYSLYQTYDESHLLLKGPFNFYSNIHVWETNKPKEKDSKMLTSYSDLKIFTFGNHDASGDEVFKSLKSDSPDLFILLGNYSYDVNDEMGMRGDSYFLWMEPIFTRSPVILTPGNHENFQDTQFFNQRFMMPGTRKPADNNLYALESFHLQILSFNFDYIMVLPEVNDMVDMLFIQILNKFRQRDDKHFNIFFSHRPFHCKKSFDDCVKLANDFNFIEKHLNTIKINLNLWGHIDHYERLRPIYDGQVIGTTNMLSLIAGTGGNAQDKQSEGKQRPVPYLIGSQFEKE
jgi:hypothetical protein